MDSSRRSRTRHGNYSIKIFEINDEECRTGNRQLLIAFKMDESLGEIIFTPSGSRAE